MDRRKGGEKKDKMKEGIRNEMRSLGGKRLKGWKNEEEERNRKERKEEKVDSKRKKEREEGQKKDRRRVEREGERREGEWEE